AALYNSTSVRVFIGYRGSWVSWRIARAVRSLWLSGSRNVRTGSPAARRRCASSCSWVVLPTPSGPSITIYLPLFIREAFYLLRHAAAVFVCFRQHHVGRPCLDDGESKQRPP